MPKGTRALSIDSAAAEILAVLDGEAKRGQKPALQRRTSPGRGLARSLAFTLEIPPQLAEPAGEEAVAAMMVIKRAIDAGNGSLRQNHLTDAQKHIGAIDPARHGRLVQHLQAIVLSLGGRGGDTEVAHVTPGEWIIPDHMLTPDLIADLHRAARAQGIDPATLQVGSGRNSINLNTGQMEFADPVIYPGGPVEEITVTSPRMPLLEQLYFPEQDGYRGTDRAGSGAYGASRRGGASTGQNAARSHAGVDLLAAPGANAVSPVDGTITNPRGTVYNEPDKGQYKYTEIQTPNGYLTRVMYVDSALKRGDQVTGGVTPLGTVQDLTKTYPGITNHLHVEVRDPREIADPTAKNSFNRYLPIDTTSFFKRYNPQGSK